MIRIQTQKKTKTPKPQEWDMLTLKWHNYSLKIFTFFNDPTISVTKNIRESL